MSRTLTGDQRSQHPFSRKVALALCLAAVTLGDARAGIYGFRAQTLPLSAEARIEVFATCTGRFLALREHQWLLSDPDADAADLMHKNFLELTDALIEAAPGLATDKPMAWRIAARTGLKILLERASFGNGRNADMAAERARIQLNSCRRLLLS